jgi:hypothetical protein
MTKAFTKATGIPVKLDDNSTGQGRLTSVFSHHRVTRGDPIGLRLVPEHIHLFPATGTV